MMAMLIKKPGEPAMVSDGSSDRIAIRLLESGGVRLDGGRSALDFVRHCVSEVMLTRNGAIRVPTSPDAAGSELAMLRVRVDEDLLRVIVIGRHLVITSRPQSLALFCSVLNSVALGTSGGEHELRFREGHSKIDPRSIPLVVGLKP